MIRGSAIVVAVLGMVFCLCVDAQAYSGRTEGSWLDQREAEVRATITVQNVSHDGTVTSWVDRCRLVRYTYAICRGTVIIHEVVHRVTMRISMRKSRVTKLHRTNETPDEAWSRGTSELPSAMEWRSIN